MAHVIATAIGPRQTRPQSRGIGFQAKTVTVFSFGVQKQQEYQPHICCGGGCSIDIYL